MIALFLLFCNAQCNDVLSKIVAGLGTTDTIDVFLCVNVSEIYDHISILLSNMKTLIIALFILSAFDAVLIITLTILHHSKGKNHNNPLTDPILDASSQSALTCT